MFLEQIGATIFEQWAAQSTVHQKSGRKKEKSRKIFIKDAAAIFTTKSLFKKDSVGLDVEKMFDEFFNLVFIRGSFVYQNLLKRSKKLIIGWCKFR